MAGAAKLALGRYGAHSRISKDECSVCRSSHASVGSSMRRMARIGLCTMCGTVMRRKG